MEKYTEDEGKTLKLFNFVFLTYFLITTFSNLFSNQIRKFNALDSQAAGFELLLGIIIILLAIVTIIFAVGFFVLAYKSTKILLKYGKIKTRPVFWLILLFTPIVNFITAIIVWKKNHNLLKEA